MKKQVVIILLAVSLSLIPGAGQEQPPRKAWDMLKTLVLIPGVSGREAMVADFICSMLPSGLKVERDTMDNVWFTVGSGRPHLLFVAHTDELGLIVEKITPRGTLEVSGRGGFIPKTYEGWPVIVYSEKGPLEGIVSPRPDYDQNKALESAFSIEDFEVYLGAEDEKEVRSLGVSEGSQITIRKMNVDLVPGVLAARGVDDRAGCAALLEAALTLDWAGIEGMKLKITFAWDVEEEVGLRGASHLAKTLNPDYVFAVDTFVSSDSPFASRRFAFTPLGKGAVIRAVDSSSIAPREEVEKIKRIAHRRSIPIQVGNTRGGNDGSVFVLGGAVNIPLSWPGVYSHSFIEKIHRSDLEALTSLIKAIILDWTSSGD